MCGYCGEMGRMAGAATAAYQRGQEPFDPAVGEMATTHFQEREAKGWGQGGERQEELWGPCSLWVLSPHLEG